MNVQQIDSSGGFPIMEEVVMYEDEVDVTFKLIYEAAVRLRATGMSDYQSAKIAMNIYREVERVLADMDTPNA